MRTLTMAMIALMTISLFPVKKSPVIPPMRWRQRTTTTTILPATKASGGPSAWARWPTMNWTKTRGEPPPW